MLSVICYLLSVIKHSNYATTSSLPFTSALYMCEITIFVYDNSKSIVASRDIRKISSTVKKNSDKSIYIGTDSSKIPHSNSKHGYLRLSTFINNNAYAGQNHTISQRLQDQLC